jgi:hypothetical protein
VQREVLRAQLLGELAVAHRSAERDALAVDRDVGRQPFERDQLARVGDVVEGMPRPQHAHPRRRGDDLLELLDR